MDAMPVLLLLVAAFLGLLGVLSRPGPESRNAAVRRRSA
jgi:hypothetical protein